jgi:hypothetical protein
VSSRLTADRQKVVVAVPGTVTSFPGQVFFVIQDAWEEPRGVPAKLKLNGKGRRKAKSA